MAKGKIGRPPGSPNKDKAELRALTQEAVLEFTDLRRHDIVRRWTDGWRWHPGVGWRLPEDEKERVVGETIPPELLDQIQPRIDEWDPVVELAVMAANYEYDPALRRQANSDAAQYLRPKLKSIEILSDPRLLEQEEEKQEMLGRLVDVLDGIAQARSNTEKVSPKKKKKKSGD